MKTFWISFVSGGSVMELMRGEMKFFEIEQKMQRYFKFECNEGVKEVAFLLMERK